jgi:endonuclease/exonuclease/phosphatase family metal-dependent hydrolase
MQITRSSFCALLLLVLTASPDTVFAQNPIPIFEAKQQPFGSVVSKVAGRVTVGGQFRNTAYLQDASGGIAVFNNQFRNGVQLGDSVIIENGTLTEFQPQAGAPGTGLTQLTGDNMTFTVVPTTRLEPVSRNVTITRLAGSSGEELEALLVRIRNVSIIQTGTFQGETTYTIRDGLGNDLDLRLDGGTEIARNFLPIPSGNIDIIGVVSQFRGAYQVQPRFATDVSLPPVEIDTVSRSRTLDVSTWNVLWLGADTTRGPRDKNRQIRSIRQVIDSIRGDVVAVQEVVSMEALSRVADSLTGSWSAILATDVPSEQKMAYVYNTQTIVPVSNGLAVVGAGDAWANGRFPFRFSFRTNINGTQRTITAFNVHGKATDSATRQRDYERRVNDFRALANYLNEFYADSSVILLGDVNDIATGSVIDSELPSPLVPFIENTTRWNVVTKPLEERGLSSYVGFNRSFLDHIIVSQDLTPFLHRTYLETPTAFLSSYTATVSDHVPVTMRLFANGAFTSVAEQRISTNNINLRVAPSVMSEGGTVELTIDVAGHVEVDIVNALGNPVAYLTSEFAPVSATRILPVNAGVLSQGMYFVRARVPGGTSILPFVVAQ